MSEAGMLRSVQTWCIDSWCGVYQVDDANRGRSTWNDITCNTTSRQYMQMWRTSSFYRQTAWPNRRRRLRLMIYRLNVVQPGRFSDCGICFEIIPFDTYCRTTWRRRHLGGGRVGMPFPLLKCLRTPKCTRLQDFAYTISNFYRRSPASFPVLGPRQRFPVSSLAFPLFLFHQTATDFL